MWLSAFRRSVTPRIIRVLFPLFCTILFYGKRKMPKIKECNITSKRTVKVSDQYLSFEVSLTSDVSDIDDDVVDEHINSLYDKANSIIDMQAEDGVKSIVGE